MTLPLSASTSTPAGTRRGAASSRQPDELPPFVDWAELGPEFFRVWGYPHGKFMPEHVSVYGPSGSGKTFFVTYILTERANLRGSHAVVIATKKADATLTSAGWPVIDKWPPDYGQNQVIFWSRSGLSDEEQAEQKYRIDRLTNQLWVPDSNEIVTWDELPYVVTDLGLRRRVITYYREGRGNGITNVAAMQRPSDVTRYPHSEAGWTVAFKPKDQDDRKRVAEVFGNRRYYMDVLEQLDREQYEFLIKRELTGEVWRSVLPSVRPHLIKRENHPR